MPSLTDNAIRQAKRKEKPYLLSDGDGLYLEIHPNGRKYWRVRVWISGKEKKRSLGVYPKVTLRDARRKNEEIRNVLREGKNPFNIGRPDTFAAVAEEWMNTRMKGVRSERHVQTVESRLRRFLLQHIGELSVTNLKPTDILPILRRIEAKGAYETAHRTLQICGQVCRFAIASGRAETDPTYALRGALVPVKSRHYPTITDPGRIRSLGTSIRKYTGTLIVRCALEFAMLTAARSGELCAAQWGEIDPEKKLWVIPASRMKMRRIHTVPLSRQALEVLDTLRPVSGDGEYLFPSLRQGRHVSRNSLTCALRILGYEPKELVVHGFRAMFSTLANEHGWPPDVIERQLAHVEQNAVRAAYNHAEHLETRLEMMQWWADFCFPPDAG